MGHKQIIYFSIGLYHFIISNQGRLLKIKVCCAVFEKIFSDFPLTLNFICPLSGGEDTFYLSSPKFCIWITEHFWRNPYYWLALQHTRWTAVTWVRLNILTVMNSKFKISLCDLTRVSKIALLNSRWLAQPRNLCTALGLQLVFWAMHCLHCYFCKIAWHPRSGTAVIWEVIISVQ